MSSFFGRDRVRQSWFEQRHDHFVRRTVADFFSFVDAFHNLYREYLLCRTPEGDIDLLASQARSHRQRMWDQLRLLIGSETDKGPLWELKDTCHMIWPEHNSSDDIHGALVDWLVGSVFHEAMKLKENIYLLNAYGPAARRIRGLSQGPGFDPAAAGSALPRLSTMVDVELLIRKIGIDVGRQMEQIAILLGQATCILRLMMPELSSNPLVVRLLIEEEDTICALWGEEVESVLADMFAGSAARGFCVASRSYLAGQWYGEALAMYERALACDDGCNEAREKIAEIEAMPEVHAVEDSGAKPAHLCCRPLPDRLNRESGFCRNSGS